MNLRTKFTLYFSALILVITLGISESIFLTQKTLLQSQLEENRNKIYKDFRYACSEALVVKDEILIFNTIKSVIKTHYPAIVYAGYVSPSDTILFSARDPGQEDKLKTRITKVSSPKESDFSLASSREEKETVREFAFPVYTSEEYRGTVKVGFSQQYLDDQVREGVHVISREILKVAVIAMVLGIILANILAFYIIKPIKTLARAADDIGSGNLDVQVKVNRSDEIGKLGRTFNQMARKLKELDELKDGFVSSVSHELRSPLAAIDGYCDYLLDGLAKNYSKEKQEKSLRIIKDATIRLTNFINNILDVAKMKAGKFELRKTPVNAKELAFEIVSLFESLAAQQQKTLVLDASRELLPPVDGDPEKIKQVITNLIGNALKFTKEGATITVGARLASPEYVEMWIADTGIGIPQEAVGKVFEKFYQVKESDMKKPKGTGLGLTIVAEIVKLHGGKIWVESDLGKGSTFRFTLPVVSHNF